MLICSVSLRPPRSALAADITEAVTAADATATGNVIYVALADDPASVADLVDAYSGENMLEPTSADAVADAGLVYVAAVDEDITATAAHDGAVPTVYTDAIVEPAMAAATTNASTVVAAEVTTTSIAGPPLFPFDPTLPSTSSTVIDAGR